MDACVRCGDVARAHRTFDAFFTGATAMRPDGVALGVLLRAYGASRPPHWGRITQLLDVADRSLLVAPSLAVYNELLDICARENNVDKAAGAHEGGRPATGLPDFQILTSRSSLLDRQAVKLHQRALASASTSTGLTKVLVTAPAQVFCRSRWWGPLEMAVARVIAKFGGSPAPSFVVGPSP
eukprot:SM000068S20613  [mRNA]  locus=s68:632506:633325:+ [translate_table: standard]